VGVADEVVGPSLFPRSRPTIIPPAHPPGSHHLPTLTLWHLLWMDQVKVRRPDPPSVSLPHDSTGSHPTSLSPTRPHILPLHSHQPPLPYPPITLPASSKDMVLGAEPKRIPYPLLRGSDDPELPRTPLRYVIPFPLFAHIPVPLFVTRIASLPYRLPSLCVKADAEC